MRQDDPNYPVPVPPTLHLFYRENPMAGPLKAGDVLFTDQPDAEVNEEMQFAFGTAISEPGVIENALLLETLQELSERVGNVITQFEPLV
jgi:hypothetical protein